MDRFIEIKVNENGDCSVRINGLTTVQVGLCVGSMLYQIQKQMPLGPRRKEILFELFAKAMSDGYDVAARNECVEECQA